MKKLRIGLDIDDCLAGFWDCYRARFDTDNNPKMLEDDVITNNVNRILIEERNFWLNLPVINRPDFVPELYCTKRVNPKCWTRKWLELHGLPIRPIYQMFNQYGNKARMIKGRVDVFVDDSVRNVLQMQAAGVPALLYHTPQNADFPMFKVFSLREEEIVDAYEFMMKYS